MFHENMQIKILLWGKSRRRQAFKFEKVFTCAKCTYQFPAQESCKDTASLPVNTCTYYDVDDSKHTNRLTYHAIVPLGGGRQHRRECQPLKRAVARHVVLVDLVKISTLFVPLKYCVRSRLSLLFPVTAFIRSCQGLDR